MSITPVRQESSSTASNKVPQVSVYSKLAGFAKDRMTKKLTKGEFGIEATVLYGVYLGYKTYTESFHGWTDGLKGLMLKTEQVKGSVAKKQLVRKYVAENWHKLSLPAYCNQKQNQEVLVDRILKVVLSEQTEELKGKILTNISKNLLHFLDEFDQRIKSDMKDNAQFQRMFQIDGSYKIASVRILGEETHNKGRVPLLVEFEEIEHPENKVKIIYKPRSMIAEETICGEEGLFASVGNRLPVYKVYNRDGEDYGYCQFLENKSGENTFDTKEEVEEYVGIFFLMDRFAKRLGLSDQHGLNIVTERKTPHPVDMEVVMVPTESECFETSLLDGGLAGWTFLDNDSKNRIWMDGDNPEEGNLEVMSSTVEQMAGDQRKLAAFDRVVQLHEADIEECRGTLSSHSHRFILIPTDSLASHIQQPPESAWDNFSHQLKSGLQSWGFTHKDEIIESCREKFLQDLENNDVPVFYFDPASRKIRYHDIELGTHIHPDKEKD